MIYLVLLLLEIVILFLLSRAMSKTLSRFMSINLLSFIYLPGIVIHELSHFFMAVILFVSVGDMEFSPKRDGHGVRLGSVEIAKTDPIRRSMIGFAPVFVGLMIIVGIVYFFSLNILFFQNMNFYSYPIAILILVYLLFAVANTMFSSSRDMEGTAEVLIVFLIVFVAAYILGFRPSLLLVEGMFTKELVALLRKSAIFLLAPIMLDLFILGTIRLTTYIRSRI